MIKLLFLWKFTLVGYSPNNFQIISAEVPLAQMFGYATELRSLTQGRAVFTMQFSHYSPLPQKLQDEITEKYSGSTVSN